MPAGSEPSLWQLDGIGPPRQPPHRYLDAVEENRGFGVRRVAGLSELYRQLDGQTCQGGRSKIDLQLRGRLCRARQGAGEQ
jgi:hypothetical protein